MMDFTPKEVFMTGFDGKTFTIGDVTVTTTDFPNKCNHTDTYPLLSSLYSYNYPYYSTPDKTNQAFRVAKVLMDKELVKVGSVRQFISLIEELISVL